MPRQERRILSPLCLPFHHSGTGRMLTDAVARVKRFLVPEDETFLRQGLLLALRLTIFLAGASVVVYGG